MKLRHVFGVPIGLVLVLSWIGCHEKAPVRIPSPPPPSPQESRRTQTVAHLVGPWELSSKGATKQIVFDPGGQVTFHGGLEYFNPGIWRLDPDLQELKILLPNAPNEKLDIFHMYVGNGVKAFDRARKEITYAFTTDTWELNMAGWTYSKTDKPAAQTEAEPVFK